MDTVADIILFLSVIGLIAGLIKPKLFHKLTNSTHQKKKIGLVCGLGILIGLIILLANMPAPAAPLRTDLAFKGDAAYCDAVYKDNGNGTTTWSLHIKRDGELITHLSDKSGHIYRHDEKLKAGYHSYTAPVAINNVSEINGLLYIGKDIHTCNISPAHNPQQSY